MYMDCLWQGKGQFRRDGTFHTPLLHFCATFVPSMCVSAVFCVVVVAWTHLTKAVANQTVVSRRIILACQRVRAWKEIQIRPF